MMLLIQATRYGLYIIYSTIQRLLKSPAQGPVIAYMKKVGDATTDVGYGAGWFKIMETGLNIASEANPLDFNRSTTDLFKLFSARLGCHRLGRPHLPPLKFNL
jgi:hypothetical protein